MSPSFATLICLVGTLGLFLLERHRGARTSPALWLPVMWVALGGSRNFSSWFSEPHVAATADQYLDGSPFDRNLLSALILCALVVVFLRRQRVLEVLRLNVPLVVFLAYTGASMVWSDYPFVTLKHWTKMLGNIAMVLVVLTDPDAISALKRLITRAAFVLIPASILLIRYYPDLGRYYDRWEGKAFYSGVTEDKNMLGCTCLILGLGILWRFVDTFWDKADAYRHRLALGTVLAMILWLLNTADSATSKACFLVGGLVIIMLGLFRRERPAMVHLMVGGMLGVGVIAYVFHDAFALLTGLIGRNTTLTGRVDMWPEFIGLNSRPWTGEGFESFFLGDRLTSLWAKFWFHPTEAHNGYLDTYLTLGFIGLGLLLVLMGSGYRNAMNMYRSDPRSGSLRLAYIIIAPIYNITEAPFKVMNPLWIFFLLAATVVPVPQRQEETALAGERKNAEKPRAPVQPGKLNWVYQGPPGRARAAAAAHRV